MGEEMVREFNVTEEYPLDKKGTIVTFVGQDGTPGLDFSDILKIDKEEIIGRESLNFKINGNDYTLPPKGKYGITEKGWKVIANIISQFIPSNLNQIFSQCINEDLSVIIKNNPNSYILNEKNIFVPSRAMLETGLDLLEMNSIYEYYVNSCMIRILKRYAATLYSMCEKIWTTAEEFCLSIGYKFKQSGVLKEKVNKFKGLTKTEIAAVKAKNKIENPSVEKKKRTGKEIKFRSMLMPVDSVKNVNAALINDKLPQKESKMINATQTTVPLYMIANFHNLLVSWNNSSSPGLRFTFPPFFVVDGESIWNLNTSKDLVLYKEVSLTALKTLKSPMVLYEGKSIYSPICLELSDAIDEIAEGVPGIVKKTFKQVVGNIIAVFGKTLRREEERRAADSLLREQKKKLADQVLKRKAEEQKQSADAHVISSVDEDEDEDESGGKRYNDKRRKLVKERETKPSKAVEE